MSSSGDRTLADYVAVALSPVLIMALVGSLVFFLVEVLYVGQYHGSLLYILFFFVFGAVLVSRMSMQQETASRAGGYGAVLGILTWIGLQRFVEYPPESPVSAWAWAINLFLLGLIWWSTHRLTWDCTVIEDDEDTSGVGLLEVAGLDQGPKESPPQAPADPAPLKTGRRRQSIEAALSAWWQRYCRYRAERRRRPRTPGVWVVYFSLAALPLYGVGQSLIPASDLARRRHAFWLMSIYVASGLGLLLTTCFLGLRRYLRQRKLQMPPAMTGVWLVTGATLIILLLTLGAVLPRPSPEYALVDVPWLAGSKDRDASRLAQRGQSPGKGEGRGGPDAKDKEEAGASRSKQNPDEKAEPGKGKAGSQKTASKDGKSAEKGSPSKDKGKGQPEGKSDNKDKSANAKGASAPVRKQSPQAQDKGPQDKKDAAGKDTSPPNEPPSTSPSSVSEWAAQLAKMLKWVVLAVFALVVGFLLLRALLAFLANFTGWARRLLDSLRAFWEALWRRGSRDAPGDLGHEVARPPPMPFRSFRDPFLSGKARRMSVPELVRYTFEALEAWAFERGLPRQAGETPLEFGKRLVAEVPALEVAARRLVGYYAGLAYARAALTDDCRPSLRHLWQVLGQLAEPPVAAGATP
jgi:hypothetical protein